MRGMKMIGHPGSFEVRYDNSPLPWIASSGLAGIAAAGAGLGCKRQDVDAFTSHIHLMRPPSGGLFVCAGPFAYATPRDDGAPPTNGGRRGFASFARGPCMEPDMSDCPHCRARLLQAPPKLIFGDVRVFNSPRGLRK